MAFTWLADDFSCETSRERGHRSNQQKWIHTHNEGLHIKHYIQCPPLYTWPSECPLNVNMATPTSCSPAAIMTQCTHLPFKPTRQHEADLCVWACMCVCAPSALSARQAAWSWPLTLRIMAPPCASEQGDEIDLCGLLLCLHACDIWQHKIHLPTHTHTHTFRRTAALKPDLISY